MSTKLRAAAGRMAPAGWKETLVWAGKVAVFTFLGEVTTAQLFDKDLTAEIAAASVAITAGGSILINRALAWAAAP